MIQLVNMQTKNILYIGPVAPPVTGQSIAFTRLKERMSEKRDTCININYESSRGFVKSLKTIFSIIKFFYLIHRNSVNVVYLTVTRSTLGCLKDIIFIFNASMLSIKVVAHLHGADLTELYAKSPPILKYLLIKAYARIDVGIVLTEGMRRQFSVLSPKSVKVVANFFEPSILDCCIKKKSHFAETTSIHFLFLSNLMEEKGIIVLLNAFQLCLNATKKIKLTIVGNFLDKNSSPKFKFDVLEKIRKTQNVEYSGALYGEEKRVLLLKSDIFVLPTFYKTEAIPLSIIEAMATENAIISTFHNYIPELVNDKFGVLVKPNDEYSLASAMLELSSNKKLLVKMKKQARVEAMEKYTFERHIESMERVFSSVD